MDNISEPQMIKMTELLGHENKFQWENTYNCWIPKNPADRILSEKFKLPETVGSKEITYQMIIKQAKWMEEFSAATQEEIDFAVSKAFTNILDRIEKKLDPEFTIFTDKRRKSIVDYLESQYAKEPHLAEEDSLFKLEKYISFSHPTTADVLRDLNIIEGACQMPSSKLLESLVEIVDEKEELLESSAVYNYGNSRAIPHPVVYTDPAINPYAIKFGFSGEEGILPAGLWRGELRPGWGDIDADAEENMWRDLALRVDGRLSGAIVPPNFTNLKKFK